MSFTDPKKLRQGQYRDARNLNARINLHLEYRTNPTGWPQWVFAQLALPAQANILEVGCGPGDLWLENLDAWPSGWQLTLSDVSAGMVGAAQQRIPRPTTATVAAASGLPFSTDSYDAVIANHMLYHVPDLAQALGEIRRVLRPGGTCYAATNGETSMHELHDLFQSFDPSINYRRANFSFSLESGATHLAPWFSQVTRHDYPDSLAVTAAEPLAAYMTSLSAIATGSLAGREEELTAFLQRILDERGVIEISKSVGLFVGR